MDVMEMVEVTEKRDGVEKEEVGEKRDGVEKVDVAEKTSEADLSTSELDLTAGSFNSSFGLEKNSTSQLVKSSSTISELRRSQLERERIEMEALKSFDTHDDLMDPAYRCKLCDYATDWKDSCVKHMQLKHSDLCNAFTNSMNGDPDNKTELESSEVGRKETKKRASTVYTNPDWKEDLRNNFKELIVQKCSEATKAAFEENVEVDDLRSKKNIRTELMDSVTDFMIVTYGGVATPKVAVMRDVAAIMGFKYPNMFQDRGHKEKLGYGLGGNLGNKQLPNHLVDRFKARLPKKKPSKENLDVDEPVKKKGKHKEYYGVDNSKYSVEKKDKDGNEAIAKANEETDTAKREAVYEKFRPVLQHQIRNSGKNIKNMCRGFFAHWEHLAKHFTWLTNVESLVEEVEQNLYKQIGFMLKFLLYVDKSLELKKKLEVIDRAVEIEYDGSRTYKDLEIMRILGTHFDSDGSSFFKLENELPSQSPSPFILVVTCGRSMVFEVWVEHEKLIGNLSLSVAIATFFHLAFTFDLKYNKSSQTLADILQRKVASYGDDSGTRTACSKQTAKSKYNKYLMIMGEILSRE